MRISETALSLDPNLVLYLPLDNYDGQLNEGGSRLFSPGKYGNGMQTDGGYYQYILNSLGIQDGAFSFHFWIEQIGQPSSLNNQYIFESDDNVSQTSKTLNYEWVSSGVFNLHTARDRKNFGSTGDIIYTYTIPTTSFVSIDWTNDGSTHLLYVHGVQVGAGGSNTLRGGGTGLASAMYVGRQQGGLGSFCILDEFAAFTRALTATEVANLAVDVPQGVML